MTPVEKVKRPKATDSKTIKLVTGCGNAYITPSFIDGRVQEVFVHLGKAGGCAIAQSEALCRCISIGLRYGVPLADYVEQLRGISCPSRAFDPGEEGKDGVDILSCADGISKVLEKYVKHDVAVS
jgi:ribonucleoside-diphosphate reductase alpha chain